MSEDRYVCCGDVIPEGRQVCPKCERMVGMGKPRMYGAFAPYTPNRKMDERFYRKGHEKRKLLADNSTPKAERRQQKEKRLSYGV